MKITVGTRDRLRALGRRGESLEDVVVAALDLYESERFWAAAEAAATVESPQQRTARLARESAVDEWMDALG